MLHSSIRLKTKQQRSAPPLSSARCVSQRKHFSTFSDVYLSIYLYISKTCLYSTILNISISDMIYALPKWNMKIYVLFKLPFSCQYIYVSISFGNFIIMSMWILFGAESFNALSLHFLSLEFIMVYFFFLLKFYVLNTILMPNFPLKLYLSSLFSNISSNLQFPYYYYYFFWHIPPSSCSKRVAALLSTWSAYLSSLQTVT